MGCGASQDAAPPKKLYAFRVRVVAGLNLYNNSFGVQIPGTKTSAFNFEGKSDPYVVLESHGMKHKTTTILHDQNPTWNEEFVFAVDTRKPWLNVKVFDADLGKDDCIGTAQVQLHGLLGKEEREIWLPLKGAKGNGEIGLVVQECYRMWVKAESGVDVQPMDSLSGSSDCYLTVQVGQQPRQQTAVKGWTLNPVWNQRFLVYVPYGSISQLSLILWDHDRIHPDCNMGWHHIKLDGVPKVGENSARKLALPIINARGTLNVVLQDETDLEPTIADPGPATETDKAAFPPSKPQTCTFTCKVVGAFNLGAADSNVVTDLLSDAAAELFHEFKENKGTSDPFARVSCEGQVYDTHHINNTLEPQWNSYFRFVARSRDSSFLDIQLWDHDIVDNDCIGRVKVPLNMIQPGKKTELWSFLDRGRGEVGIELNTFFQLKVRVVSATGLPAKDLNGMCDPYCVVTLAGKEYKTRVCRETRDPWFEEDFRWFLPTLKNQKLHIRMWDSDLMILKKGLSEDLLGECEVSLEGLKRGIPNELELDVKVAGKVTGKLKIVVLDEIPIPPSALDQIAAKGKEAYEAAMNKVNSAVDFFKTITEADYEKKQEPVVEPFDPKIAPRPRYSRVKVDVIGIRGLQNCSTPLYVGVSVPSQGQRYKTKEKMNAQSPDFNESFEFRLPTKTTTALELSVFESGRAPYTSWSNQAHSRAVKLFRTFNDGAGIIRGSPCNDIWLPLSQGGEIGFRVFEMFRFAVRVKEARGLSIKTDPYIAVATGGVTVRTKTVPNDPAKDRLEGVPGQPIWDECFTFFANQKGTVKFLLMDDTLGPDQHLATTEFNLGDLRRGVPVEKTLKFDKGGELDVYILEEEKMALLDQVIDAAANAAKLAMGAADELKDKAGAALAGGMAKLGGLFGN